MITVNRGEVQMRWHRHWPKELIIIIHNEEILRAAVNQAAVAPRRNRKGKRVQNNGWPWGSQEGREHRAAAPLSPVPSGVYRCRRNECSFIVILCWRIRNSHGVAKHIRKKKNVVALLEGTKIIPANIRNERQLVRTVVGRRDKKRVVRGSHSHNGVYRL